MTASQPARSTQPSGAHAKPPRRSPWIIGIVLCAVALLGVVAVLTSTGGDDGPAVAASASPSTSAAKNSESDVSPSPSATQNASASAAPNKGEAPGGQTPIPMQDPITLDATAQPVTGLIAHVRKLEAVQGEASAKGEVAGPAIRFEIYLENKTAVSVPLANTVVNVDFGTDHNPASALAEPGGVPLPDALAPGKSATGVYVFTVPSQQRDAIRILLDYSVDVPIVVFAGAAPR